MGTERKAHILIVDDRRETARAIRSSLEGLNLPYVIADVPSGEEAMLEFQRVPFDLMITEYRLPGISGIELIERARQRSPDLAVFLTTSQGIKEVSDALGEVEIAGIFEKPIDEAALVEAVINLLGGHDPASDRPSNTQAAAVNPPVDARAVVRELSGLRSDLAASATALVGQDGTVIGQDGDFDDSLRFRDLAQLLSQTFHMATEIGMYLGNGNTGTVNYYPGHWYDLYALGVAEGAFLVVLFPGGNQKQMGAVLRFGRATVEVLANMIAPVAGSRADEEMVILKKTGPLKKRTGRLSPAAAPGEDEAWEEEEEAPIAFAELLEEDTQTEAIDLDFDELDAELAGLEDVSGFWEDAESDLGAAGRDSISIDEAIELGLVPKDMDE